MAIEIGWDNPEKTIIIERFEGRWTWDEFYAAIKQAAEIMGEVDHRVDILADMLESAMPPVGSAMTNIRSAMSLYPDNWGIIVIVANNMVITTLINMFRMVFRTDLGKRTYATKTIEEAYGLIAEQSDPAVSSPD